MQTNQIVSQELLIEKVLPEIKKTHNEYYKFRQVHARRARIGEKVATITSSGLETTNIAKSSHQFVIKNSTSASEQYLITEEKLLARYILIKMVDSKWGLYSPLGSVLAIDVTNNLINNLGVHSTFKIMAPWGTEQLINITDMLVSPLPELNQIYRVDITEFNETYKKAI